MTTSVPRTTLDSIVVLRLLAATTCGCGEPLHEGERVGYTTRDAAVLCLRCTAEAKAVSHLDAGLATALDPQDPAVLAGRTTLLPPTDLALLQGRCIREVAAHRSSKAALEHAYHQGVGSQLVSRAARFFHSTGSARTRVTATTRAVTVA